MGKIGSIYLTLENELTEKVFTPEPSSLAQGKGFEEAEGKENGELGYKLA